MAATSRILPGTMASRQGDRLCNCSSSSSSFIPLLYLPLLRGLMATGIQSVAPVPSPLIIFLPHLFVPLQSRSLSTLQHRPTVCTPTTDPFFHNHLIITYPAVLFNFCFLLCSLPITFSLHISSPPLSSPFLRLPFLSRDQVSLCNTFLSVG